MTAHMHATLVEGCYRCELGRDEEAAALAEQAADEARQAACREHDWMQRGTPGNEWRECYLCGKDEDL